MTIAEIQQIECERDSKEKYGVIHLIKENNFYRAHDWSAWLMTMFPFGEAVNKPLKISAKKLKDGYIEAWVGFPISSIERYVPNDGSVTFTPVSDVQIDVTITLSEEYLNSDADVIRSYVDDWKEGLPLNDSKGQKREDKVVKEISMKVTRISDVMSRVLSFPLSNKSPMEAWEFLKQLQQQLAAMF